MRSALLYLVFQSWKNRFRRQLRRLKQPTYLVFVLAGLMYLVFIFSWQSLMSGPRQPRPEDWSNSPEGRLLLESAWALGLFSVVLLSWVIPHERAALIFSEAEVAFLFPAPVRRNTLIHFKLLRSQIGIFFITLVFTLLSRRSTTAGAAWERAIGWWVIFSTLRLHFLAASFIRTILLDRGVSNWKRRTIVLTLVAAAAGAVIYYANKALPEAHFAEFTGFDDVKAYFEQAVKAGPLPYLLYPFRLVVKPYLTREPLAFLGALGPALGLMLLHYWWVVRSNVAFEEASVEASQKFADRIAQARASRGQSGPRPTKKKRAPFKLSPVGPPAIGILWKNLIGAGQAFSLRIWFLGVWFTFIAVLLTLGTGHSFNFTIFIGILSAMFLALSFGIGPQLVRQDFRQDLPMADLLKLYPMKGWHVAIGELMAPAAILTAVQWLLIILCVGLNRNLATEIPLEPRLAAGIGLAIVAPFLNFVMLIIPNTAVLMFPGWFRAGKDAPRGIEATGQRLIFSIGQLAVFMVCIVPAAIIFATIFVLSNFLVTPIFSVPTAAAAAALIMAVEVWLGVMFLGRLFEKFDISSDAES
jgi:hypothetical protein